MIQGPICFLARCWNSSYSSSISPLSTTAEGLSSAGDADLIEFFFWMIVVAILCIVEACRKKDDTDDNDTPPTIIREGESVTTTTITATSNIRDPIKQPISNSNMSIPQTAAAHAPTPMPSQDQLNQQYDTQYQAMHNYPYAQPYNYNISSSHLYPQVSPYSTQQYGQSSPYSTVAPYNDYNQQSSKAQKESPSVPSYGSVYTQESDRLTQDHQQSDLYSNSNNPPKNPYSF